MNPGVSNSVLLRFFHTFSKSEQFSDLTCNTHAELDQIKSKLQWGIMQT